MVKRSLSPWAVRHACCFAKTSLSAAKSWTYGPWTNEEMDLLAAEAADLLAGDGFDEPDDS
jgi:hypothetical protein